MSGLYERIAIQAPYVFLVLISMLAVCAARSMAQDGRAKRDEAAARPYFGLLTVTGAPGASGVRVGQSFYLSEDATLGKSPSCDIRVRHKDMPRQAARIIIDGNQMRFYPSCAVYINDEPYTEPIIIDDGTILTYGELELTVRIPD